MRSAAATVRANAARHAASPAEPAPAPVGPVAPFALDVEAPDDRVQQLRRRREPAALAVVPRAAGYPAAGPTGRRAP